MTARERKFCEEYARTLSYKDSFNAAFRNKYQAWEKIIKLTERQDIREYIDSLLKLRYDKTIADRMEVMEYLTMIMRGGQTVKSDNGKEYSLPTINKPPTVAERFKSAELLYKKFADVKEQKNESRVVIVDDIAEK